MLPAIIIQGEQERVAKPERKQSFLNLLISVCIQWMLTIACLMYFM